MNNKLIGNEKNIILYDDENSTCSKIAQVQIEGNRTAKRKMISYLKFKEIFDKLDSSRKPEIEIYFKDCNDTYVLVKDTNSVIFGKCNDGNTEKLSSLDELYTTSIINEKSLKEEWENTTDILIDMTFSVVTDKEEINRIYNVDI